MSGLPANYLPRIVDDELSAGLRRSGAVLVEGPKASGKTLSAMRLAKTVVRVDDETGPVRQMLEVDPAQLLEGPTPVLLDEWQMHTPLWNLVRREVDARQAKGQFILTGSSTPDDDARRHSGAGRFSVIQMRPMSLYESGHSTGEVSLEAMFEGTAPRGFDAGWTTTGAREQIAERIVVGGWPGNHDLSIDDAIDVNRDYLEVVRHYDIPRATGTERDPDVAMRVMRSFARGVSTSMSESTIARDLRAGEVSETGGPDATSRTATRAHLDALRRLRLVEDQPAWSPNMRSSRRLQSVPKRHFVDPSLAVAALRAGVEPIASDVKALGLLFESLAVRDLRVYVQRLGGRVAHYRDYEKLEIDAIVELPDGRWGAFEIKLGTTPHTIDSAAQNLLRMASHVNDNRCAFLAVLTNGGIATRRPDGVDIVPLRMLGP